MSELGVEINPGPRDMPELRGKFYVCRPNPNQATEKIRATHLYLHVDGTWHITTGGVQGRGWFDSREAAEETLQRAQDS